MAGIGVLPCVNGISPSNFTFDYVSPGFQIDTLQYVQVKSGVFAFVSVCMYVCEVVEILLTLSTRHFR